MNFLSCSLKSVWKMYDAGEDRKLVIKRIWKYESELDFMLDTHQVKLFLPSLSIIYWCHGCFKLYFYLYIHHRAISQKMKLGPVVCIYLFPEQ
jgi:hypothetical protein